MPAVTVVGTMNLSGLAGSVSWIAVPLHWWATKLSIVLFTNSVFVEAGGEVTRWHTHLQVPVVVASKPT